MRGLDARTLQLDLEGEGGRSVAYADAKLVIEEGQASGGSWRARLLDRCQSCEAHGELKMAPMAHLKG